MQHGSNAKGSCYRHNSEQPFFNSSPRFSGSKGSNPFKKPKFTGDCEDLKECVFDCEDERQASIFEANMKKLSIYAATK
jgi:hypothetical protein